ncbi:ISAzo13 family transposase [Streptomyces sp. CB01881]|uniref:ISAzo13 family transposase n=1 Tax=Streptomyces sp. CB01881 TaxID=2078691 RepID=UPI000CDC9F21|nr:ISAzo13 family transposase [Streptomyces sp. CB01881]AUY53485.1 ISAzo13 family transposase [Streptomyces sp. CB01881]TYC69634.1 ISAzo13 family transposase [Streptomyces sp. CB01881]
MAIPEAAIDPLAAKFQAVFPHLDERQRRLVMGAEALSLGHGGIRVVARAAGVREGTVSRGAAELEAGEAPLGRVRRPGGGRKRAVEVDPGLRPALLAMVEPDLRGDPMSPLRWTTKSTRRLAAELTAQGHKVSADTVGDLLREEGFSLQGNSRVLEGADHPDRDAQFRYINDQVKAHQASGDPVVSVDAKKKEQVGEFHMAGREWQRRGTPVKVRSHDFLDRSGAGLVIPYGVYDLTENTGWVGVGTDHDTAAFAVATIRRWWQAVGQHTYPGARRLLITADAGGSNGYRTRAWKVELAKLAGEIGLEVTVCHFPPGTSKWNRIEHRLFSQITLSWRGRPLTSHEVVVNTIASTTTRAGLRVRAELDTAAYATGGRISNAQLQALPLRPHDWHGDWNYTLLPQQFEQVMAQHTKLFDQPSPEFAWLCVPKVTGIEPDQWATLVRALGAVHEDQRETQLHQRRGHARKTATGGGRPPRLTLVDRLIALFLHDRLGLPQTQIARLFHAAPQTISIRIGEARKLLESIGQRPRPAAMRLRSLDELRELLPDRPVTGRRKIKKAS